MRFAWKAADETEDLSRNAFRSSGMGLGAALDCKMRFASPFSKKSVILKCVRKSSPYEEDESWDRRTAADQHQTQSKWKIKIETETKLREIDWEKKLTFKISDEWIYSSHL